MSWFILTSSNHCESQGYLLLPSPNFTTSMLTDVPLIQQYYFLYKCYLLNKYFVHWKSLCLFFVFAGHEVVHQPHVIHTPHICQTLKTGLLLWNPIPDIKLSVAVPGMCFFKCSSVMVSRQNWLRGELAAVPSLERGKQGEKQWLCAVARKAQGTVSEGTVM